MKLYSEHLAKQKAQEYIDRMEAASFTAWQLLTAKGYKKSFEKYKKGLGLSKAPAKKIDKEEKSQVVKTVASILNRLRGVDRAKS